MKFKRALLRMRRDRPGSGRGSRVLAASRVVFALLPDGVSLLPSLLPPAAALRGLHAP